MRRTSLLLPALLVAGMARAQTPVPASSEPETIYSDAQREEDGSVSRRAVQSVMQESKGLENQYPRWKTPVCFNVHGLTPIAKFVVERRMKEIARQVGVTLDRQDPCVPNVTVLVTPDAQATMQSIYEADPDLLGPEYTYIVNDLKRSQPVQAWYGVAVKGSEAAPIGNTPSMAALAIPNRCPGSRHGAKSPASVPAIPPPW